MTTPKQAKANRRNADHSSGPKTEEGKAAIRFNAVQHGLTGQSLAIPGESGADIEDFADKIVTDLDPLGALEEELARDVAFCLVRLRRAARAEAALYRLWLAVDLPERERDGGLQAVTITPQIKAKMKKAGTYRELTEDEIRRAQELAQQKQDAELGEAISLDSSGPNALLKLARYEAALSRRRDRSLAALLALQRERQGELHRELNA